MKKFLIKAFHGGYWELRETKQLYYRVKLQNERFSTCSFKKQRMFQ